MGGGNLARQALEKGFHVIGVERPEIADDALMAGLTAAQSLRQLAKELAIPRKVYSRPGRFVSPLLCLAPSEHQ